MLLGLPVIDSQLVQTYLLQRRQLSNCDCRLSVAYSFDVTQHDGHGVFDLTTNNQSKFQGFSFSPVSVHTHKPGSKKNPRKIPRKIFQTLFLKVKHHLIAPDEPRQCMKSSLLMTLSTVDRPFPTSVVAQSVIKNNTRVRKVAVGSFWKGHSETSELSEEVGPKKRHARRSKAVKPSSLARSVTLSICLLSVLSHCGDLDWLVEFFDF